MIDNQKYFPFQSFFPNINNNIFEIHANTDVHIRPFAKDSTQFRYSTIFPIMGISKPVLLDTRVIQELSINIRFSNNNNTIQISNKKSILYKSSYTITLVYGILSKCYNNLVFWIRNNISTISIYNTITETTLILGLYIKQFTYRLCYKLWWWITIISSNKQYNNIFNHNIMDNNTILHRSKKVLEEE